MFNKEIYVARRDALKKIMKSGLLIIQGTQEAPANFPNNTYTYRQDSSFLYFFGLSYAGLTGVIDIDNDKEYIFGDDISIVDLVWYGPMKKIKELAEEVGVPNSAPVNKLQTLVEGAKKKGQTIHYLPPFRYSQMIQISDLLGIHPLKTREEASVPFIKAVVQLRAVKQPEEIKELEEVAETGYLMHTTAMKHCSPKYTEHYVAGLLEGIAHSYGSKVSFQTILSCHGEVQHGTPTYKNLEPGRLMLCDAGAENANNYCSDNTRTTPVNGKYSQRQLDIYSIVEECHDLTLTLAKPGVKWWDVHFATCRHIVERMKELGLMKGDTEAALKAGAHALFMPHGLGHMMGLDVHDMEGLGQVYVGFDDEVRPSTQFGTNCLRCGRRLQEGFVMTDEPGIYFIPALIDEWRANGTNKDFLNFDKIETFKDFGGIRIEDDLLITKDGCRYVGKHILPYHPKDVEEFIANNER